MTEPEWWTEDVSEQIAYSARRVSRNIRSMPASDLYQEGVVWAFSHPRKMEGWMSDTENPKRGWARFTRAVEGAMTRVARQEKASREGYDPDDEVFYGIRQIELCLPALWDEHIKLHGPSREPAVGTSNPDPSEGNTWAVMVLDVQDAWGAANLDAGERAMLRYRYGSGATYAELGRAFEVAASTAESRVKKALRKMQRHLGGAKPADCDNTCTDCGGPGSRHAMSNATARAITDGEVE